MKKHLKSIYPSVLHCSTVEEEKYHIKNLIKSVIDIMLLFLPVGFKKCNLEKRFELYINILENEIEYRTEIENNNIERKNNIVNTFNYIVFGNDILRAILQVFKNIKFCI